MEEVNDVVAIGVYIVIVEVVEAWVKGSCRSMQESCFFLVDFHVITEDLQPVVLSRWHSGHDELFVFVDFPDVELTGDSVEVVAIVEVDAYDGQIAWL
jgi:hypothetical protein